MKTDELDELIAPRVMSRYRQMGVFPGWDRLRLFQLAHLANRTPEELGAMAGLQPNETRRCLRKNRFSPPVSLHFVAIEAAIREVRFGEPVEPILPLDLLQRRTVVVQEPHKLPVGGSIPPAAPNLYAH